MDLPALLEQKGICGNREWSSSKLSDNYIEEARGEISAEDTAIRQTRGCNEKASDLGSSLPVWRRVGDHSRRSRD